MEFILRLLTSLVDTSHAISVEEASWPFTKHLISDFVHLYFYKEYVIIGKIEFWNCRKVSEIVFVLPVVYVNNCQHKPFTWLEFIFHTMLITFSFDFHGC